MTQWTITKDNIAEPGAKPGTNSNTAGLVGPSDATLTSEQIANHPDAIRFRMLADDGTVYYEGFVLGPNDFAPLDDLGEPNAGCTSLEIFEDGEWRTL